MERRWFRFVFTPHLAHHDVAKHGISFTKVTLYAVQLFSLLGITGSSEQLLATAVFGIVKLVAALVCAFFLVDFLGRKRSLSIGIILQAISMGYIAIYLTAHPSIATSARGMSASARHAGTGAIVFIYVSGIGWAVGWNTIQYLLNVRLPSDFMAQQQMSLTCDVTSRPKYILSVSARSPARLR